MRDRVEEAEAILSREARSRRTYAFFFVGFMGSLAASARTGKQAAMVQRFWEFRPPDLMSFFERNLLQGEIRMHARLGNPRGVADASRRLAEFCGGHRDLPG